MPDLEVFEAEVKTNIKTLSSSKNAKARRKAAAWLGEAGDPNAITALTLAYKNDRDAHVRNTARYALGMFRALEEAWNVDQELVGQLLEDVALNGRLGRRVPVPVRTVVKLVLGLLLAAALVAAAAFVLPMVLGTSGGTDNPPPASSVVTDRDTLLQNLRAQWQQLTADTETLRQEYQKVLGGQQLDCTRAFAAPAAGLSEADRRAQTDLAVIADGLAGAQQQLTAARAPFDQACNAGEPLAVSDAAPRLAELGQVSTTLLAVDQQLSAASGDVTQPTDVPAEPDVVPTATAVIDVRAHVVALQAIIDRVTDSRTGAATLLVQYWEDGQRGGTTTGCRETPPVIPDDYLLPADVAQAVPALGLAASSVNTGLMGLRGGWAAFADACARGTLGPEAAGALPSAQAARDAFKLASDAINQLRG